MNANLFVMKIVVHVTITWIATQDLVVFMIPTEGGVSHPVVLPELYFVRWEPRASI